MNDDTTFGLAHGMEVDYARDRFHDTLRELRFALSEVRRAAGTVTSEQLFDVEMEGTPTRVLTAALDQIDVCTIAARGIVPKADTPTHYVLAGGRAKCGATGDYLRFASHPTCKDGC